MPKWVSNMHRLLTLGMDCAGPSDGVGRQERTEVLVVGPSLTLRSEFQRVHILAKNASGLPSSEATKLTASCRQTPAGDRVLRGRLKVLTAA